MNVYKNMSALKYIIMCVNNWGLFLSQKKENGLKKVFEISDGESMCCEKRGKKRCGKVWWEREKAVPLQPQKRNRPVVVKLWRDAGGRRTGADAGFLKKKLEKKFAKNLAVKNKGSTFVTAFRKGNGAENIEMMR